MLDYPKEQLWELYQSLPDELKELVFSEKTADTIGDICRRNGISEEEKISGLTKYTGYVLLGVLPPEELSQTIKQDFEVSQESANKIAREINRFIFFPVKASLETLYKTKLDTGEEEKEEEEKEEETPKKDIYREPIE